MSEKVAKFEKVSFEQFAADIKSSVPYFASAKEEELRQMYDDIRLPERATKRSAGYDIFAPFDIHIPQGQTLTIPTGLRCRIESGWFLDLTPKSGLGFKTGSRLANTQGIIDADYYDAKNEGHIMAKLINESVIGPELMQLSKGKAFIQGIFIPHGITVDDTASGLREGGFGSTNS